VIQVTVTQSAAVSLLNASSQVNEETDKDLFLPLSGTFVLPYFVFPSIAAVVGVTGNQWIGMTVLRTIKGVQLTASKKGGRC